MPGSVAALLTIVTFFGFCDIIGPNRAALSPGKQPSYKTIRFDANWFVNEETTQPQPETPTTNKIRVPEIFKSEQFNWAKSIRRANNYGRSALAGVRDYGSDNRIGVVLGFNSETPQQEENDAKKIVCYYNIPTVYDVPFPVFPEQIDPFLCTHILVAFGRVSNFTLTPTDPRDVQYYKRVTGLKSKNSNLRVMMSVASTNDGSPLAQEFVNMMISKENRGRFIQQSIGFLETYGFDGIDIDWEFPAYDGPMEQKGQLVDLLTEFRNFPNKSKEFLVTAAVPAPKQIIDIGYDIRGIAGVVDFVNLMTYDYHYYSSLSPVTGPNSPLYNMSEEIGFFATLNVAWSAKYWYQNGMPANKIIVGIPLYGHSFKLVDERYHDYYSFAAGYGSLGGNGFVNYVTICKFIESGAQPIFNNETREPYAYRDKEWVSYDNQQSVSEKAQFIKSMNFGGAMFYSLNIDDAWQLCKSSKSKFPLIDTVKRELEQSESLEE